MDKRTALTYIDSDGSWHRASKGAPEQVYFLWPHFVFFMGTKRILIWMNNSSLVSFGIQKQILTLCNCKEDVRNKVHSVIDKFAERGLRSLAVSRQVFFIMIEEIFLLFV